MKLLANYLEPFDPNKTMELAVETGRILAKELNPKEQAIIGNIFIMIGSILTQTSHTDDEPKNKWQHAREAKFELSEIEMETQNLQKRLDKLRKSPSRSPEG